MAACIDCCQHIVRAIDLSPTTKYWHKQTGCIVILWHKIEGLRVWHVWQEITVKLDDTQPTSDGRYLVSGSEHAMILAAWKVSHSLHLAVILANRVFQFNSTPDTISEVDRTDKHERTGSLARYLDLMENNTWSRAWIAFPDTYSSTYHAYRKGSTTFMADRLTNGRREVTNTSKQAWISEESCAHLFRLLSRIKRDDVNWLSQWDFLTWSPMCSVGFRLGIRSLDFIAAKLERALSNSLILARTNRSPSHKDLDMMEYKW